MTRSQQLTAFAFAFAFALAVAGAIAVAGSGGCAPSGAVQTRHRVIDAHMHWTPASVPTLIGLMDHYGIAAAVNLSGGAPGKGLEEQLQAAALAPGRLFVAATPDFAAAEAGPGYGARLARSLERARQLGAIGLKLPKGLGLAYRDWTGELIAVDDPELDPLFEAAGALGMPVWIHTGDPIAFWEAPTPANERYDELLVHPGWSYYRQPVPSWDELWSAFARRVARHPATRFIGVHFGNAPEQPERVGDLLRLCPNLLIDTAARVPEIGRQPPAKMRELFTAHAGRVLFGTDLMLGGEAEPLVLGSPGATPSTPGDVDRFFAATWRYFETSDTGFPHPTPIQGRWQISGIALDESLLARLYAGNAEALLGLAAREPGSAAVPAGRCGAGHEPQACRASAELLETRYFLAKQRRRYEHALAKAAAWIDLSVEGVIPPNAAASAATPAGAEPDGAANADAALVIDHLEAYVQLLEVAPEPERDTLRMRIERLAAALGGEEAAETRVSRILVRAGLSGAVGSPASGTRVDEVQRREPAAPPDEVRPSRAPESIIAARLDPATMGTKHALALTQEIEVRLESDAAPFTPSELGYLSFALDELVLRATAAQNTELVARLATSMQQLGLIDLRSYRDALTLLLASQNHDGSFGGRAPRHPPTHDGREALARTTSAAIQALTTAFSARRPDD